MSSLLERYVELFKRHFAEDRVEPFFIDSTLLPGPKTEIRRQLLGRLKDQPPDVLVGSAPLVLFLAHFIDDYGAHERLSPGFFDEVNAWMKVGILGAPAPSHLLRAMADGNLNEDDQRTLLIVQRFGEVIAAYADAKELLKRDLERLGFRIADR